MKPMSKVQCPVEPGRRKRMGSSSTIPLAVKGVFLRMSFQFTGVVPKSHRNRILNPDTH